MSEISEIASRLRLAGFRAYLRYGVAKTEDSYYRQIWRAIRDLFNSEIDEFAFIDDVKGAIENQFTRAWNQGARDMGIDPRSFTDEDIAELANRIEAETNFMLQLADDILQARSTGGSIEPFRTRASMWANRYNDIVNESRVYFGGKKRLKWVVGPTEHCTDCARLNGIVATADDWAASGWRPQSQDLECGGYHCQCELMPTDEKPTEGGIPA